ncbi:MAG: hypothetical protein R3284_10180 [Rubricoccaceae bacterium]|nr:hypothetical protein [Rubricoccaceae bacterium]
MRRLIFLTTLSLVVVCLVIPEVQAQGRAAEDGSGDRRVGPRSISSAGDWEIGTRWNGSDSFASPYARYYVSPNLAIEGGGEIDWASEDGSDVNPSLYSVSAGMLYELKDHKKGRCYVRPNVAYERLVFGDGESEVTQNAFGGGVALGGDIRLTRNFLLGMEAGAEFGTFSSDFGNVDGPSGSKVWAGIYNRINATLRFPARRVLPD